MSSNIHYEVYVMRGPKSGWALLEAMPGRQEAISRAKEALGLGGISAVKVTKETFNSAEGIFATVTILEEGEKSRPKTGKTSKPAIPCFKPQDLFTRHARGVIGRVLQSTLDEWQLTPMELIHRADMLEKLEARSTVLQHAVQQVAIAQASDSEHTLHDIFRQLMDLALRAMDMVVKDARKDRIIPLPGGSLSALWPKIQAQGDAGYLLASAIALHLKSANSWSAKLRFLLELTNDLPEDETGRDVSLSTIDSFVAEMIRSPASLHDLLGPCDDLGDALRLMTTMFLGRESPDQDKRPPTVIHLTRALKGNMLDEARSAFAERITNEIKSPRRFHPESFARELESMRHLAQRLVLGVGPHMTLDAITESFATRSKRLVTQDSIESYLGDAASADDKVSRLIELEENVVGAESKRRVAAFMAPLLAAPRTELQIGGEEAPVTTRLRRIAELQGIIAGTHFDPADKREILAALELLGNRIAERYQFFKSIEQRQVPCADKVLAILQLMSVQAIPQGDCMGRARTLVQQLLRRPDFMPSLCPEEASPAERKARYEEFKTLYDQMEAARQSEAAKVAAETAA